MISQKFKDSNEMFIIAIEINPDNSSKSLNIFSDIKRILNDA